MKSDRLTTFSAFTLVELLVTIGISLLLIAAATPLFLRQAKGQTILSEARIISNYVGEARNFAIHPENENAISYRVKFISPTDLKIVAIVMGPSNNPVEDSTNLGNGLKLVNSKIDLTNLSQSKLDFTVSAGEFQASPFTIPVQLKNDNSVKANVIVRSPGSINVE